MDQELINRLDEQDRKLSEIKDSVEKTRRYFLWTLIATVVTVLLPLLALVFLVPWLLATLSSSYGGLL